MLYQCLSGFESITGDDIENTIRYWEYENSGFRIMTRGYSHPASLNIFPRRIVVIGVSSDGFTTIELPAARAGAIFLVAINNGWLLCKVLSVHKTNGLEDTQRSDLGNNAYRDSIHPVM
jgi:hypothetical protein